MRRALLRASQSAWLCQRAPRLGFVRRTAKRFLPGEMLDAALAAASQLAESRIATLLTHLGENVTDRAEAEAVTGQYLGVIEHIRGAGLPSEISVKLTQLGLDLDREFCFANLGKLIERSALATASSEEPARKIVWIDMEQSPYVDFTLELYRRAHKAHGEHGRMRPGIPLPHGKGCGCARLHGRRGACGEGRLQRAAGNRVSEKIGRG